MVFIFKIKRSWWVSNYENFEGFPYLVLDIFEIKVFMVVLFPYKVIAETSNSNISKTTQEYDNIFRDIFSSQYLSSSKKIEGKKIG